VTTALSAEHDWLDAAQAAVTTVVEDSAATGEPGDGRAADRTSERTAVAQGWMLLANDQPTRRALLAGARASGAFAAVDGLLTLARATLGADDYADLAAGVHAPVAYAGTG
jgi:hypothetical protein